MDRVRQRTKRKTPLTTKELIEELNPVVRGWREYYKRAHFRRLFHRLDAWIVHRLWSHRFKRWCTCGWKQLPKATLYGEYGLINLVGLIHLWHLRNLESSRKLPTRNAYGQFGRRTEASASARLLPPDTDEAGKL